MYESYFGLRERPFSIAPDPQYLYMSARHKEAMAHLSYGLSQGGCFIVLTGEVGTGKTTLCRNLLEDLPDNVDVALILNANINETELLQSVCDELKIDYQQDQSQKQLLDGINQHLLTTFSENRHTVLIIDEAQLLSRDVLEQIRLLTNLETTKSKLLQIILIGQPELNDLLSRNDLRQLAQRVTARYHLGALHKNEIQDYVNFRLGVAGCKQPLFSRQALNKLHQLTAGIPRKINVLADHALLAAYSQTQRSVDSKTVKNASKDVFIENAKSDKPWQSWMLKFQSWRHFPWLGFAALLLVFNLLLWWLLAPSSTGHKDEAVNSSVQTSGTSAKASQSTEKPVQTAGSETAEQQLQTRAEVEDSLVDENEESEDDPQLKQKQTASSNELASAAAGTVIVADEFLDASSEVAPVLLSHEPSARSGQGQNSSGVNFDQDTTFGKVLDTSADLSGRISAFRSLAQQWGESLPQTMLKPACQELAELGLYCLDVNTLAQLRRFNRPAILVLEHNDQLHRVILQQFVDGSQTDEGQVIESKVRIQLGDEMFEISDSELLARWTGDGVLFWQPAFSPTQLLSQGVTGPTVVLARNELNKALAAADMPLLNNASSEFDLDMTQKVFALQSRYAILADGQIGSETYLLMNELNKPSSTPVLRNRVRGGRGL